MRLLISNEKSGLSLGQESETRNITRIGDNSNFKDDDKVISRQIKKQEALKMVV